MHEARYVRRPGSPSDTHFIRYVCSAQTQGSHWTGRAGPPDRGAPRHLVAIAPGPGAKCGSPPCGRRILGPSDVPGFDLPLVQVVVVVACTVVPVERAVVVVWWKVELVGCSVVVVGPDPAVVDDDPFAVVVVGELEVSLNVATAAEPLLPTALTVYVPAGAIAR